MNLNSKLKYFSMSWASCDGVWYCLVLARPSFGLEWILLTSYVCWCLKNFLVSLEFVCKFIATKLAVRIFAWFAWFRLSPSRSYIFLSALSGQSYVKCELMRVVFGTVLIFKGQVLRWWSPKSSCSLIPSKSLFIMISFKSPPSVGYLLFDTFWLCFFCRERYLR